MAITAQELNIILSARDKQFTRAMDRAQRRVERFSAKSQKDLSRTTKAFNSMGRAARSLAPILAGLVSVQAVRTSADFAVQIGRLSQVANASTTEFQKFAQAARTVGIEQDKVADILKDVNDRVGDFLATGGGPMKDFFENVAPLVGVTADQFRNLSGPQALQLYVDTLQKAGASQQDFTFYLEAMASDTTALLPLLKDQGAVMRQLGTEAERTGRIINEDAVAAAVEYTNKAQALNDTLKVQLLETIYSLEDELIVLKQFVTDYGLPAFEALVKAASASAGMINTVVEAIQKLKNMGAEALSNTVEDDVKDMQGRIDALIDRRAYFNQRLKDTLDGRDPSVLDEKDLQRVEAYTAKIALLNQDIMMLNIALEAAKKELKGVNDELEDNSPPMTTTVDEGNATGTTNNLPRGLPSPSDIQASTAEFKLMGAAMDDLDSIAGTLESSFESVFMSALDGAQSFEDTVKQMAVQIIRELYRVLVVQTLVNAAMTALGVSPAPVPGVTGNAAGGAVTAGRPTVVGEHGREIFVPSTSGRVLSVPQAKAAVSGAGAGIVINQSLNISTGVSQTVKAEIQQMLPRITETTKAAVADAARRGGSYSKAFG
jgi:hypothetical protein